MVAFFISLFGCTTPNIENHLPSSLASAADLIAKSKDPVDGHWLPNLTGLPNKEDIALLSKYVEQVLAEEDENTCRSIDFNLKMLVFQHFMIHQHMANAQHVYFDDRSATKWAHVLAMVLKESSGDPTNITDMSGHSVSSYKAQTNLRQWKKILDRTIKSRIKLDYQTNFGLTQVSADRLFVVFHLAKNRSYNIEFLMGKHGILTPRKVALDTAIAIRRLIWFYQDFAQGRILQSDDRIHQKDIKKPEFSKRYKAGLEMALLYCGTRHLFHERHHIAGISYASKLQKAIASIAYCRLGTPKVGYGRDEYDEKCFAEWVTICPALNIDIALLTPLSYFQTRGAKPVCEKTFKRLINKRPVLNTTQ